MLLRTTLFLVLNFGLLAIGGAFTDDGVASDWYQELNKAPLDPSRGCMEHDHDLFQPLHGAALGCSLLIGGSESMVLAYRSLFHLVADRHLFESLHLFEQLTRKV